MVKLTRFVWMYLFLAALQSQIVIDSITLLAPNSSKEAQQHDNQNNRDPELAYNNSSDTPSVSTTADNNAIIETPSRTATCTAQTFAKKKKKQSSSKDQTNTQGDRHQENTKQPNEDGGDESNGRLLSEKTETRFKKVYKKKCKRQQDERINSREDLPVSTEPYKINLLDRKFYCNDDGIGNLYAGPDEIAAKLRLEYKDSPVVTLYPFCTTVKQPSESLSVSRSPPKVEAKRLMLEDNKIKNAGTPTRITLAAYKKERRRRTLKHSQS